jgi:RNA polymerase sigma factor (sigma-70 family)
MKTGSARSVLRQIRTIFTLGTFGGLTDAQLLELFLTRQGDEAEDAFAALVHRHAPMVLGVCRRMLRDPDDAEDAFQAAFFILARRAASIGRRGQLASWLHGVAVRTASEARRSTARQRARERRLMEVSRVDSAPAEEWDDHLPLLDEELNRLPRHYRAALVACELEGKSRAQAARELGLREGTLSTHLARGRKLLRERLLRRGVCLGIGPPTGLGLPRHVVEAAITERLIDSTVRASLSFASGTAAAGAIPRAAASLAERVLWMMPMTRLSLLYSPAIAAVLAAAVVLGWIAMVAGPLRSDPIEPGAGDLAGRAVDLAGKPVADVRVWAVGGKWDLPETVAAANTDAQGRFVLPQAWDHPAAKDAIAGGWFGLFARGPDGRVGWLATVRRQDDVGKANTFEIAIGPVGEVRGRVIDHSGRPIAGVWVSPIQFSRPGDSGSGDSFTLCPEAAASYVTKTAADGSFVLAGISPGARLKAAFAAEGYDELRFSWDTTRPVTFTLDNRLGRIKGRVEAPDLRGLAGRVSVRAQLRQSPGNTAAAPDQTQHYRSVPAGADGSFRIDNLPPGRYLVDTVIDQNAPFGGRPAESVEVGPGAVVEVAIHLERLATITGRVVDAETGKGIAGVPIRCYRSGGGKPVVDGRWFHTDADGRYSIAAEPGAVRVLPESLPKAYLMPKFGEARVEEVRGDLRWPDLKIVRAATLDGIVVDPDDRPVAGADVLVLQPDRGRPEPPHDKTRTGPDGTFHFDGIDPDDAATLWARTLLATTNGGVKIRPRDVRGKVTLTIDPKFASEIRGMATDGMGKRIVGAKVTLWWGRPDAVGDGENRSQFAVVLDTYATRGNGWFVFRGLWPQFPYGIVVEANGHNKAESSEVTGKSGETQDVGKLVLLGNTGRLAGRVVDSAGRPMSGVAVFNRGDSPTTVATSTDSQGRFRLGWLYPGPKYAFARKEGYRFAGARADGDTDDLVITMRQAGEPAPAWKPAAGPTLEDQRAFAKRVVIRLREKYGPNADQNGGYEWALAMAPIDPALALEWSAEQGHKYDSRIRHLAALEMARTDARGVPAFLAKDRDGYTQAFFQELAERYSRRDRARSLLFADEAVARARELGPSRRAAALAAAGAVQARAGRAGAGRGLIDEAVGLIEHPGDEDIAAQDRAIVAAALAPFDLERALALLGPIEAEDKDRCVALVARAIATSDPGRAVALADAMQGEGNHRELVKTPVAYRIGADRPDEAIRIIEGIQRDDAGRWQAEAFGWLAVALAPRDRERACALIDRALAMTMDDATGEAGSMFADDAMLAAAHVAARARQIGYPDMESVLMRVMATRDGRWLGNRYAQSRFSMLSVISQALLDPVTARTALEQLETRGGLSPVAFPIARRPRLLAWALIDLEKAEAVFEAEVAGLDKERNPVPLIRGMLFTVQALATPPEQREMALKGGFYGGSWRPMP